MARAPIVLGQPALQIGQLPSYAARMAPRPVIREPQPIRQETGALAATDAFDAGVMRPLGGGGIGEAAARFGEAYLTARGARENRDKEETDRINEANRENARREALAQAVASYDPSQPPQMQNDALIRALSGGAPEEALGLATGDVQQRLGQEREQTGARDQYAWQRQYDNENPPGLTPYQERTLALTERGQNISAANARAGRVARPLRGPDAALMTDTRTTATSARGLRGLVQDFLSQMESAGGYQGPGSGVQVWNPHMRAMSALAARMTGLMRPVGSGATSDFEQRLYARGAPSVDNTPEANREIAQGLIALSNIADARQFFYEAFADEYGSLNQAEQAFQQSPEFRALTQGSADGQQTQTQGPGFDNGRSSVTVDINGNPIR